ncbi:hypothetical protein [Novosphingobium sp. BL-52-GroH]|uniref:hypothetical protein n=1 Tax=Novosphingobium sp. BL-52-GroH TaxID=3349877 RepID=UPI00385085CB
MSGLLGPPAGAVAVREQHNPPNALRYADLVQTFCTQGCPHRQTQKHRSRFRVLDAFGKAQNHIAWPQAHSAGTRATKRHLRLGDVWRKARRGWVDEQALYRNNAIVFLDCRDDGGAKLYIATSPQRGAGKPAQGMSLRREKA